MVILHNESIIKPVLNLGASSQFRHTCMNYVSLKICSFVPKLCNGAAKITALDSRAR